MTINILDVAKYFNNEKHQVEALSLLQEQLANLDLSVFEQKWRSKAEADNGTVVAVRTQTAPLTFVTEAVRMPATLKFSN